MVSPSAQVLIQMFIRILAGTDNFPVHINRHIDIFNELGL